MKLKLFLLFSYYIANNCLPVALLNAANFTTNDFLNVEKFLLKNSLVNQGLLTILGFNESESFLWWCY